MERGTRIFFGIPKYSSKVVNTMAKKNAVRNAPTLSTRKILFGLEARLVIICRILSQIQFFPLFVPTITNQRQVPISPRLPGIEIKLATPKLA